MLIESFLHIIMNGDSVVHFFEALLRQWYSHIQDGIRRELSVVRRIQEMEREDQS